MRKSLTFALCLLPFAFCHSVGAAEPPLARLRPAMVNGRFVEIPLGAGKDAGATGGWAGPAGADQVLTAAWKAALTAGGVGTNALAIFVGSGTPAAVSPYGADQVLSAVWSSTQNALAVYCISGCGGSSGASLEVNGGAALNSPVNFQNGSAVEGLAINFSNPSGSNVQAVLSGTLLPSAFGSQTANQFLVAPNGSNGNATFRAMVAADVPAGSSCGDGSFVTGIGAGLTPTCASGAVNESGLGEAGGNISLTLGSGNTWQRNSNTLTGTSNFGTFACDAASTSTGYCLNATVASGSAMLPFAALFNGNGVSVNTSGVLAKVGSGHLNADEVNGGAMPVSAGLLASNVSSQPVAATYANVVGLFGSGSCSGYLKSDGTCSVAGGSGTVTQSSSAQYNAAVFTSATNIQGVAPTANGQCFMSAASNYATSYPAFQSCPTGTNNPGGGTNTLQYNTGSAFGGITDFSTNGTTTITGAAGSIFDLGANNGLLKTGACGGIKYVTNDVVSNGSTGTGGDSSTETRLASSCSIAAGATATTIDGVHAGIEISWIGEMVSNNSPTHTEKIYACPTANVSLGPPLTCSNGEALLWTSFTGASSTTAEMGRTYAVFFGPANDGTAGDVIIGALMPGGVPLFNATNTGLPAKAVCGTTCSGGPYTLYASVKWSASSAGTAACSGLTTTGTNCIGVNAVYGKFVGN
jgi:hypothetical protein